MNVGDVSLGRDLCSQESMSVRTLQVSDDVPAHIFIPGKDVCVWMGYLYNNIYKKYLILSAPDLKMAK